MSLRWELWIKDCVPLGASDRRLCSALGSAVLQPLMSARQNWQWQWGKGGFPADLESHGSFVWQISFPEIQEFTTYV